VTESRPNAPGIPSIDDFRQALAGVFTIAGFDRLQGNARERRRRAGGKQRPNARTPADHRRLFLSYERFGFSAAVALTLDPTVVAEFTRPFAGIYFVRQ
jgi:hypothetical protein